ncbi:ferroxidase fet3 [Coemansia sp. RSA 2399]|nr:ferroxidase fet3 [Coemansia sp. RSA 2399]
MAPILAALVLYLLPWAALAATVHVRWNVGYVYMNRDGNGVRRCIGVNGTLPIPPIHIVKGDTLVLQVNNMLDVPTSMHAHGLFQNGTTFLDGPSMVSQCGIPPAQSFTYIYKEVAQSGLYWLHSHTNHQNTAGLRTPLVVHDLGSPPYQYDGDRLLWFEDWYPREFDARANQTIHSFPPPITYPSALVNGYDGGKRMPALLLAPAKTYRIRLVNMSTTESFRFSIPGHPLHVIETDGYYTLPYTVDGVDMGPGQRYSVLVNVPRPPPPGRADPNTSVYKVELYANFIPKNALLNPLVHYGPIYQNVAQAPSSLLARYSHYSFDTKGKEKKNKKILLWSNDILIQGLANQRALPVDRQIVLNIGGAQFSDQTTRDVINNITYANSSVPTLNSVLTLPDSLVRNTTLYGGQTHSVVLDHLEVIELLVKNSNLLAHPMHLHGHRFQVVEYGPIAPNERPPFVPPTTDDPALQAEYQNILDTITPVVTNLGRPTERDTVSVPPMQYVKIRFRADNPGVWLFHCHMDIHFAMGMAMTFIEAPELLRKSTKIPKEMLDMCNALGIKSSGNAVGAMDTNLAGLPVAPSLVSTP